MPNRKEDEVKRYKITTKATLQQDLKGDWVRYDEVERMIELAIENASRLEMLHKALVDIATVPVSLPNANAAVERAKEVLTQVYERFGRITGNGSNH